MPTYQYKAADKKGNLVEGSMEAKNEDILVKRLYTSQLRPINISKENNFYGQDSSFFSSSIFNKITNKDILEFTQQFSILMNAGLNIDRSLAIMGELKKSDKFKEIVNTIHEDVHQGVTFTEALNKQHKVFSKLYISMVRAGEEGGVLDMILGRLALLLEKSDRLKEKIKSALIYPLLLTFVGGCAVIVLITFVVPKFARIFSDMGEAIPAPTKMLINISSFTVDYWWLLFFGLIGVGLLFKAFASTKYGKLLIDTLILKIPLIGAIQLKVQVSRFTRTLGTLLKSGVPLLKAILITNDTLTNSYISKSLGSVSKRVREGGGICNPIKETKVFPPLAIHIMQVGEETGQMDEMLLKVSDTYDVEIENAVERFISILEPLMILVMAIIVGFIVISMLLAIFSINDLPL